MSKIGNLQNARGDHDDTNQRLLLYCHPGNGISYRCKFLFSCCMICYIPTAASCFQHGQKTREEVKVLGVCRWWMITKSWGYGSVYPLQSTTGYVLFSPPAIMSHTSIHDQDRDRQDSSASSLMGIDAVASTDETHERAGLLDVESDSIQYGTSTQLPYGGGRLYSLLIAPFLMLSA